MNTDTVTAIVVNCSNPSQAHQQALNLRRQTKPPDQLMLGCCCYDSYHSPLAGSFDRIVYAPHENDWGHRFCDAGIRLANTEWLMFANSDDHYDMQFIEILTGLGDQHTADLVMCDYTTYQRHGGLIQTKPEVGSVTRGSFIVRTEIARIVGYNHRVYEADGLFVEALVRAGATYQVWSGNPLLFQHL